MDHDIPEKEVTDASRKLKNNKASAQDLIKNEMIKSALPVLSKQTVKIFNIILSTGQFHQSWTKISLFLFINKVVNMTLIIIVA